MTFSSNTANEMVSITVWGISTPILKVSRFIRRKWI